MLNDIPKESRKCRGMPYVSAHQRVTSAEEDFSIQVDRMTRSAFLQILLSLASGLMNELAMVAGMEVMHGSAPWPSTPHGHPGYSHSLAPSLPEAETNTEFLIDTIPQSSQLDGLAVGQLHWTTSITGEAALHCCWNRHLLWVQICSPYTQCCCKNCHLWVYRLPYPCHGIPHTAVILIRELISQQQKCSHGPRLMNSLVLPCGPSG